MKEFEMSQEQLDEILDVCKPVPMIAIHCGNPPSQQENANEAWRKLGEVMGFEHMTVQPSSKGRRFFTATPRHIPPCKGIEIEPGAYSGCDQSGGDCPECGK